MTRDEFRRRQLAHDVSRVHDTRAHKPARRIYTRAARRTLRQSDALTFAACVFDTHSTPEVQP